MPDASSGAGRKTYGGRGGKKCHSASMAKGDMRSGTISGPIALTPLIARTGGGGTWQESPQVQGSPLNKYSKYKGPLIAKVDHIQELKKEMPPDMSDLVRGLSEAYANLLQATTTGEEKRWKGTRSLFGSCLRKMPQYIQLEEHFAQLDKEEEGREEDDGRDICQEIYMDLEGQFETVSGQGWRAFKQVVRAHGTSLLCDAFADGLLGPQTLNLLVDHCLNASAWDEAERLLWSFSTTLSPLLIPNNLSASLFDEKRSRYLWMVKRFVNRTGRHRFLYELLEYIISQELLPLEWLATACMHPIWDRLVRTLTDGDHRTSDGAFNFLETAIRAGIGLPKEPTYTNVETDVVTRQFKPSSREEFRDALNTTFSSLLSVLCSIALANRRRDELGCRSIVERVTWVVDAMVIGVLTRKDIQDDLAQLLPLEETMQVLAQRAVWVVSAAFLLSLDGCHKAQAMVSLSATTMGGAISWILSQFPPTTYIDNSDVLGTIPGFVSAVARGTGKIWQDYGFEQIQRSVQGMISISGIRLPHQLWTLKRLALESSMDFAQSTRKPQHMEFAREVEKSMRLKGNVVIAPTPRKNDSPSVGAGFKWEEGIGEWVQCTPVGRDPTRQVVLKPMPVLQLLPSPSSSREGSEEAWKYDNLPELDEDDGNDCVLPYSPVVQKHTQRSSSSLGKRMRASSPMVVIPAKRRVITPPDTPVLYFSESDSKPDEEGPCQLRRSRRDIRALISGLRSQRSRPSLDKGLRNLERKTYEEPKDIDTELEASSDSDTELDPETSFSSVSSVASQQPVRKIMRLRRSFAKIVRREIHSDGEVCNKGESQKQPPALKRRQSGRGMIPVKEWWKVEKEVR